MYAVCPCLKNNSAVSTDEDNHSKPSALNFVFSLTSERLAQKWDKGPLSAKTLEMIPAKDTSPVHRITVQGMRSRQANRDPLHCLGIGEVITTLASIQAWLLFWCRQDSQMMSGKVQSTDSCQGTEVSHCFCQQNGSPSQPKHWSFPGHIDHLPFDTLRGYRENEFSR